MTTDRPPDPGFSAPADPPKHAENVISSLEGAEGVFPFFMSNSGAEKHGLKNGPAIVDLVASKAFRTSEILEQITLYGFMCAFQPCEKHLRECNLEQFVVVCDPKSKHGEMFLLLHTEAAINGYQVAAAEANKDVEDAERKSAAAEEEARLALENVVYVETPIIAGPYKSDTCAGTIEEVKQLSVVPEKPLNTLHVSRPLGSNDREIQFGDRNHDVSGVVEVRSTKIHELVLDRIEKDAGIQVAPFATESSTQTARNRSRNAITQYEPIGVREFHDPAKVESDITSFLESVLPRVETALQQNETVDIFSDAMHVATENNDYMDHLSGDDSQLKELRNFADLEYTKGRILSCIDWHPSRTDIVATSVCKAKSFESRVATSGHADSSFLTVWEFSESLRPRLVLKSPQECLSFHFNPTCPSTVVGGCMNGQVMMWDLSDKLQSRPLRSGHKERDDVNDTTANAVSHLNPCAMSHIDSSHRRTVADVAWMPPNSQINAKGQQLASQHLSGKTFQFITVSSDGQALFWDTRFRDILAGKLPYVAKPRVPKLPQQQRRQEQGNVEWVPIFRLQIKRLEGSEEVSLCKLICPGSQLQRSASGSEVQTQLYCASEEGDMICANWNPKSRQEKSENGEGSKDGGIDVRDYVEWMEHDHNRPCVSLAQSPFFPSIIVSVSEWKFHIWHMDAPDKRPVFTSPRSTTHFTVARWSPTRPSVLLLAKEDGSIDVWDFTDSSYSASTTYSSIPSRITSMEFLAGGSASAAQQLLAVGDDSGSLHIFEVPRSRPLPNEQDMVLSFFERGTGHAMDGESMPHAGGNMPSSDAAIGTPAQPETADHVSRDPARMTSEDHEAADDEAELLDEEDRAYHELEEKYISQLGLTSPCPDEERRSV